jgi:hypothetical protein
VLKTICYLLFSVLLVGSFVSCKKNNLLSKKNLEFSVDTLVFDTVFTTVGSTTKQFKIYNNEKKTVQIDQIELMGGENSPFRMNVDGNIGTTLSNIRIEGKDSLFVFVEVTLDINSQSLPMIVEDSIRFRTNGKDQYVKLAVWGQDMYFHYSNFQQEIYDFNEGIWPNDKPHVIYGAAIVDSAKTLTIQAGTQVHLHKNSVFYVYKSTLNIIGIPGNEVVFQGDRLEQDYQDVAGQYYGIYFQEARPSTIDYAILKNGTSGVHLFSDDPSNPGYTLTMTNTIIQNHARYGVFIYSGAKVKAENCIISKNGTHALLVLEGGDFNFNHCDLLGYGSSQNPAVGISNYFTNYQTATTNVGSINEGIFYNCVLSGNLTTELAIDTIQLSGVNLNFDFKNCLIKSEIEQTDAFYQSTYWNNDPMFTDPATYDFSFLPSSTLNGNGFATSVVTDIFGNLRNNPPDIGAIELN